MFPADAGKRWVLNGDPGFGGEFISDRLDWREQARDRASRLWTAFRVLAPMTLDPEGTTELLLRQPAPPSPRSSAFPGNNG